MEVLTTQTKNNNVSNVDRRAIYNLILDKSVEGRLIPRALKIVASQFLVSIGTIQRIWKQGKIVVYIHIDVSHKRTKNCGSKRIEVDYDWICEIPVRQRTTVRSLPYATKVSKSTLHRSLKLESYGDIQMLLSLFLKEENKKIDCNFVYHSSSLPPDSTFLGTNNTIHID